MVDSSNPRIDSKQISSAKITGLELGQLALIVFGFSLPSFVILGLCWSNDYETPEWLLRYFFAGFMIFGWHAVTILILVTAGMAVTYKTFKTNNRIRNVSIVGIALFIQLQG